MGLATNPYTPPQLFPHHLLEYVRMKPFSQHLSDLNILFARLPRELQAEVFLRCLPSDGPPLLHSNESPTVLLQVCKAWTQLALSTPRLWSSFRIEFQDCYEPYSKEKAGRLLSVVASWLARSGEVPISVTMTYLPLSSVARGYFNRAVASLVELLLQHSRRWHCMKFRLPGAALTPLLTTGPHEFTKLRTIALDLQGGWCAPKFSVESLGVNWSRLSELTLVLENSNLLTLDECWDILSLTSSLETCAMNAQCVLLRRRVRSNELVLPVESFQLTLQGDATDPAAALMCFLDSVDLPLLSEFCLRWLIQDRAFESTTETFCQFLERLQPSVELLQLAYLPVSEQQLLELLQCIPFLKHLILQFSLGQTEEEPITSNFFQSLSNSDSQLLPQLKSIHIDCSGSGWSPEALTSALDSRLHDGLKFSAFISENAENVREVFDRWIAQGLDVSMRYLKIR